ncbi:TetR/AcrR family transcriptional regulator (plasmid) [Haloferax larsenii]|uniref:TetR/AcrR family transcriptional regulator n=1 Tax=Haloferax larsenii TaxID=302484 RepID=A0ABY5RJD0_HALLR|nr:TetR/AcrR family transcriptional regulator [Haloferax larsenii]ELZ80526.1 transcription regulator [Haloferax larsenii JCM 13917]UVE52469.1 TetR/AcrR family transcriptional regulator [Haloferax larsenii]
MPADAVPPEQKAQIAHAVRQALAKHGYARLTTKKVAAESDKSEAGLYYYYDSKDEMIVAFLETSVDYLARELDEIAADGHEERLRAVCDLLLVDEDDEAARGVNIAVMELLSHAPHNETLREPLLEMERHTLDVIVDILQDGIEEGVFRDVDPEGTAAFLLSATDGYTGFALALGMEGVGDGLRDAISAYIDSLLVE